MTALLAAACGSGSPARATPVARGGTLVVGAGGQPACTDWYANCGRNTWGFWMMSTQTLIGPYVYAGGRERVSALLTGEAEVKPGPPQRVVYHINPRAVWSDGRPVTSADFLFTMQQARRLGAMEGVNVDDHDPHTAIVTYPSPTPDWQGDFNPFLPAHILQGQDVDAAMRDGYSFSDGPWVIDHWTRGQEVKLTPNPRYWGEKPKLDAVVFKIITDPSSYLSAYQTGQIDVAYIPTASAAVEVLRPAAHTHYDAGQVLQLQSLYFNTQHPPLDDVRVRAALAYATDRSAIVTTVYGGIAPGIKPAQSFMPPAEQQWYSTPFAKYTANIGMVTNLMRAGGWSRGSDGVWSRNGSRAAVRLVGGPGAASALVLQAVQSQWRAAGFDASIDSSGTTSSDAMSKGNFDVALLTIAPPASGPSFVCFRLCSASIPTQANSFQGGNFSRFADGALDGTLTAADSTLDIGRRTQLVRQSQQQIADMVPVLPIAGVPAVLAYNTTKVGGPISNDPSGPTVDLNEWYCVTRCS